MFALNRRCAKLRITEVKTRLQLYDALVQPVLTYAAEVWVGSPGMEKIELVERGFLRSLLGVRPTTSSNIVMSELGRYPLALRCWAQAAKFYNRLLDLPPDRLVCKAWQAQLEMLDIGAACWAHRLRAWLLQHPAEGEEGDIFPHGAVNVGEAVGSARMAFEAQFLVREDSSSTLRRYVNLRGPAFGSQNYLEMKHCQLRQSLARFRCGNHLLEVEVGKRGKGAVPVEQRICRLCGHGVEDEEHMLLQCPLYSGLRSEHFARVGVNPTSSMQELMANPHAEALARFMVKCLEARTVKLARRLELDQMWLKFVVKVGRISGNC